MSRTNESWRQTKGREKIELILLNATREPLQQRGVQRPFVPGGNKRCFHLRDIVKLLSRTSLVRPL